jgi:Host cell surface-exposed lipoprotein
MKKFVLIGGAILACTTLTACAEIEQPASEPAKSTNVAQSDKQQSTKAAKSHKKQMTSGQENALESAQSYIDMSGFSKKGLIRQLSSSAGEGFSKADATFAAKHVDVNWKAEAVESAQSYLDMGGFSKQRLIEQLSSSAGEGFTLAQAQYAADKAY